MRILYTQKNIFFTFIQCVSSILKIANMYFYIYSMCIQYTQNNMYFYIYSMCILYTQNNMYFYIYSMCILYTQNVFLIYLFNL